MFVFDEKILYHNSYNTDMLFVILPHTGLAEEAPVAHKDVDEAVDAMHNEGIAKKVVRLRPLTVVKG